MSFNWDAALPFVLVTVSIPVLSIAQKIIFARIVTDLSERLRDYREILSKALNDGKLTSTDIIGSSGHVHDPLSEDPAEIESLVVSDADRMAVLAAVATSVPAFILIVRESSVVVVAVASGALVFTTLLLALLPNGEVVRPIVVVDWIRRRHLPAVTRLGVAGFALMVIVTVSAGLLTPAAGPQPPEVPSKALKPVSSGPR